MIERAWAVLLQIANMVKLLTHACLRHQTVHFGTDQKMLMLCSLERSRGPGGSNSTCVWADSGADPGGFGPSETKNFFEVNLVR